MKKNETENDSRIIMTSKCPIFSTLSLENARMLFIFKFILSWIVKFFFCQFFFSSMVFSVASTLRWVLGNFIK